MINNATRIGEDTPEVGDPSSSTQGTTKRNREAVAPSTPLRTRDLVPSERTAMMVASLRSSPSSGGIKSMSPVTRRDEQAIGVENQRARERGEHGTRSLGQSLIGATRPPNHWMPTRKETEGSRTIRGATRRHLDERWV